VVSANVIPAVTGSMVFASILLAGGQSPRLRTAAWVLGLAAQAGLILFGVLTGVAAFWVHLLPATGFAVNLLRPRERAPDRAGIGGPGGHPVD
jgi:hypothetical protein